MGKNTGAIDSVEPSFQLGMDPVLAGMKRRGEELSVARWLELAYPEGVRWPLEWELVVEIPRELYVNPERDRPEPLSDELSEEALRIALVMAEETAELIFEGSLMEGPQIDLIALSGLDVSEEREFQIWEEISPRNFLVELLDCEEIDLDEGSDDVPGMSDRYFEYRCGPKDKFVERLKVALAKIMGDLEARPQ